MRDVSIEKVFEQLEKECGYLFSYSKTVVDLSPVISIDVKDASIDDLLDIVLSGTGISYKRSDNLIILTCKSGKAASKDSKKRKVRDEGTDDVLLRGNGNTLDEAIVIGYGYTSRNALSIAVASVNADKVSKAAATNMSSILPGRAAGVNGTVQNPQPDGMVNLSVRAGGSPLFVVDGIVMPSSSMDISASSGAKFPLGVDRSPLLGINPNDIETIEILKDAAAAIYGIGASDGVVIITTKKGSAGRPRISYEGSFTYAVNTRTVDVLNAGQFMRVSNVFNRENYLYANAMYPYGNRPYDGGWIPLYSEEAIAGNTIDTDWVSKVIRNGYTNNHSIAVNGGSQKIKYYLSFSYFGQQGVVVGSDMNKFIVRSNVTAELFPFLRLNTILNYNNNRYGNSTAGVDSGSGAHTYGSYQSAVCYSPLMGERDADGKWSQYKNMPNPVAMLGVSDKSQQQSTYANFSLDADIIKGMLSAKAVYGFNTVNSNRDYYIPSDIYFNEMFRSRGETGSIRRFDQTVEGTISFNHRFGDFLKIDAVAGFGFYFNHSEKMSLYYENANDKIASDKLNLAAGPFYPTTSKSGGQRRSQFIRANFDILGRYIISLALRNDGTDKFFPGKKYALFPMASAAWRINNEAFMKNITWIDQLKLRASYGITGRDNLGSSLFGLYTPNSIYVSFDETSYVPFFQSSQDNPNVTWETTYMIDTAIDFSFLGERLSGSLDWFRYDETNLLSYEPESLMSQFSSHPVNGGHYVRTGFDFNLTARPLQTKDIVWEITGNISRANTYWIEREPNYQYKSYQQRYHEPLHPYYYYKMDGVINIDRSNMPESQKSLDAAWQMPGSVIIKDKNGDGVITEDDIYVLEDSQPKLYGGLGTNFKWKGLELDIFFYGRYGKQKWNTTVALGNPSEAIKTQPKNMSVSIFDSFSSQTNSREATRPGVAYSKCSSLPGGLGANVDCYDASFIRCKNITVSYTFASEQLGSAGKWISSIRLYLDTQNPFLITKYPYEDPEIKSYGGQSTMTNYPQNMSFTFGTRVVF